MVWASYPVIAGLHLTGCGGARARDPEPLAATEALIAEAEGHERARRYDLARQSYQRAVDSAPTPTAAGHAAHRFATALAFWGELDAARSTLELAVERDPRRPGAWHDLGVVRAKLGDVDGAETALRRAVSLAARDPRPRVALAALLVKTRRYREAEAEYRRLLDLDLPPRLRRAVEQALALLAKEPDPKPTRP